MQGIKFKGANGTMGKPSTMTDEECYALPVQFSQMDLGGGKIYATTESVWELSPEELQIITESKRIRLVVLGKGMPPVSLRAEAVEVCENEIDTVIDRKADAEDRDATK